MCRLEQPSGNAVDIVSRYGGEGCGRKPSLPAERMGKSRSKVYPRRRCVYRNLYWLVSLSGYCGFVSKTSARVSAVHWLMLLPLTSAAMVIAVCTSGEIRNISFPE